MNAEEQDRKMGQIIVKAWSDDEFKQRLLTDPAAVLKAEGMDIPEGVEIRVVENTDKLQHIVLPPRPSGAELTDDDLAKAAGGLSTGDKCFIFGGYRPSA